MQKIEINSFKAFNDKLSFEFSKKNLLLYGDNGVGKSSIYEALKVVFFWERIESGLPSNVTPEEYQQYKNDLWSSYNNKQQDQDFQITINDVSFSEFNKSDFQTYMISLPELQVGKSLNLKDLLESFFLGIQNTAEFCTNGCQLIETEVNERLAEFREDVRIIIDQEDNYNIVIVDIQRNLRRKSEIRTYFNEGKISLIVLLLLFSSIYLSKDTIKKKLLILDDFITSLDIANRTFIIRYIFKYFSDWQMVIMTHNATFFNLIKYIIHGIDRHDDNWMFASLYEIKGIHKIYIKELTESVDLIKNDYESVTSHNNDSIDQLGNRIRKKFETLLHDFSKVLVVGGVEESKKILERISNDKSLYAKRGKTVYDLVDEIEILIRDVPLDFLKTRLTSKINSYKDVNLQTLKSILNDLKLYQKVTMHPMSHGVHGMASFTSKEIEESIGLLIKMEKVIDNLVDGNVTSV